jgi:hypothetical protein
MEQNDKDILRSGEMLDSFIDYCMTHPQERFWQALRNWAQVGFIYVSNRPVGGVVDTFYFENNPELSTFIDNEDTKKA